MQKEREIHDVLTEGIIRYSQVWEDHLLLEAAFNITDNDHILSIASAGCNALSLLLLEPKSVVAVDLNPAQTALVELKKAAISSLPHDEFATLMGAQRSGDPCAIYAQVRSDLPAYAQAFWDKNQEILKTGIIHAGRLEKYFRVFQEKFISKAVPQEKMNAYLQLEDKEKQSEFFQKVFGHPQFVETFKQYTSRDMIAEHGRDEAQFTFVKAQDTGQYFYDRFKYVCTQLPAKHNFYLEYLLTSNYADLKIGPPFLRPQNYDKLRDLLPRLEITTQGIDDVLDEHSPGHFSKANLSDLFEYISPTDTQALLNKLATHLRPGGHLAYWNLLVPRERPESLAHLLKPNPQRANALWEKDRAFFYSRFVLEEVLSL